jgi:hypothetical protein
MSQAAKAPAGFSRGLKQISSQAFLVAASLPPLAGHDATSSARALTEAANKGMPMKKKKNIIGPHRNACMSFLL